MKNKDEKYNTIQEVKKNTIKLLEESKFSPFERLEEIDKFRLRLKSSEGMKLSKRNNENMGIVNIKRDPNTPSENSNFIDNYPKISNKHFVSNNEILKPFELKKENLDLLLNNEKNKIEFYKENRKSKTSQVKKRAPINYYNDKIQNNQNVGKKDILLLYNNINQKENLLKTSNITSLMYKINTKIKLETSKKMLLKNLKNICVDNNTPTKKLETSPRPNTNLNKEINNNNLVINQEFMNDTDLMVVNCDDFLKSNKKSNNGINRNENNIFDKNKQEKNLEKKEKKIDSKKKQNSNPINKMKNKKIKNIIKHIENDFKSNNGSSKSKSINNKKKQNKMNSLSNLPLCLNDYYDQEMKDYFPTEKDEDEKFTKIVRDNLNEIVLENFFNFGKNENMKDHKRISMFLDDEYKVPNMNNNLIFFQVITIILYISQINLKFFYDIPVFQYLYLIKLF